MNHDFVTLKLDDHVRRLASIISQTSRHPSNDPVVARITNFWDGRVVEGTLEDPVRSGSGNKTEYIAEEANLMASIEARLVRGRSFVTKTDDGRKILWTVNQ